MVHRRTIRTMTAALVAASSLALAVATASTAHADNFQETMAPGSIEQYDTVTGGRTTTPTDGRLRGYEFAASITSAGTAETVTRGLTDYHPAPGQHLVIASLSFTDGHPSDSLDPGHPVHGTVIIDGRRTSLADNDFTKSGELRYAISVPNDAADVDLELAAAGVAQTFSLTQGRRIGDQPAIFYRDPSGAYVVNAVNTERNVTVHDPSNGVKSAATITLSEATLSYFSPTEPRTTPPALDKAFLILNGSGKTSVDTGAHFDQFSAYPADAVTATLPDGTTLTATHAGDTSGLFPGFYYFTVPADVASARITLQPADVIAEYVAQGTYWGRRTVHIDDKATFDVAFTPGVQLPAAPTTTPTTATPRHEKGNTAAHKRGGTSPLVWLLWLLAAAFAGLGIAAAVRRRRSSTILVSTGATPHRQDQPSRPPVHMARVPQPADDDDDDEDENDDSPTSVWMAMRRYPFVRVEGAGAVPAVRDAIVRAITARLDSVTGDEHVFLVLANGATATLIPLEAPVPRSVKLIHDEQALIAELEVLCIRQARLQEDRDASTDGAHRYVATVVVAPGPVSQALADALNDARTRLRSMNVFMLGGDRYPAIHVDADGNLTSDRTDLEPGAHSLLMTEAAARDHLARAASTTPSARVTAPVEPAPAPRTAAPIIDVRLFGPIEITANGSPVVDGWRSPARELLALLVARPEGVTADEAIEALWPDSGRDKDAYLRTVINNIRTVLRRAARLPDHTAIVERVGPRYRLDRTIVDTDVWRFTAGIPKARAGDLGEAEQVAELYRGDFALGEDFLWAEPIREWFRGKALDVLGLLADGRRAAGDLELALASAERAIDIDPYSGDLYERAISIQHQLDRPDAAERTRSLLERRLADLGRSGSGSPQAGR